MKDQHTKIKGYRDLSQEEIDLMNEIKETGEKLGKLCEDVLESPYVSDSTWVFIGKTHLQQGIMALVRSVAKPESF